jgi:hypothetical protein
MRQHQDGLSGNLGATAFASELERSRRYGREFCLVKVKLDSGGTTSTADAAAWIGSVVRRIDTVWTDDRACLVLLPEGGRDTGHRLVERLAASGETIGLSSESVSYSVAAFPVDAVTSVALLEVLAEPQNRVQPELGVLQPAHDILHARTARRRRALASAGIKQRLSHPAPPSAENSPARAG